MINVIPTLIIILMGLSASENYCNQHIPIYSLVLNCVCPLNQQHGNKTMKLIYTCNFFSRCPTTMQTFSKLGGRKRSNLFVCKATKRYIWFFIIHHYNCYYHHWHQCTLCVIKKRLEEYFFISKFNIVFPMLLWPWN